MGYNEANQRNKFRYMRALATRAALAPAADRMRGLSENPVWTSIRQPRPALHCGAARDRLQWGLLLLFAENFLPFNRLSYLRSGTSSVNESFWKPPWYAYGFTLGLHVQCHFSSVLVKHCNSATTAQLPPFVGPSVQRNVISCNFVITPRVIVIS